MNRLLGSLFFCIAAFLALYALLFARYLQFVELPVAHAKVIRLALFGAAFLAVAGWKFSVKSKFKIFAVLFSLMLAEMVLQTAGWLGVLPVVDTKLKAAYARVYWTSEGRGNSIRNRYGWYYPAFDLQAPNRIALIGDSLVEAVEVPPTTNQAFKLQTLLKAKSPDWSVLGLGTHGTAPAYYIEVLKYACRHFQPREAIVVVSSGSDVTESSPILNYLGPGDYIYYNLDPAGALVLNPESARPREQFARSLEFPHKSLLENLPVIFNSHFMILQLADSLRDRSTVRRRLAEIARRADNLNKEEGTEYARIGFNPTAFAVDPSDEAKRALNVLLAELQECKTICDQNGVTLRIVSEPAFPKIFYDTQHGRDWTTHIGAYDYLGPERKIVEWARSNGIPSFSMGEYIQKQKLDVDEIHDLYFGGVGHLTDQGHALCARAMFENFYQ